MQGFHALRRALGAHGLAQGVGLGGAEAGGVDGDLHELLLEEGDPEGLGQGRPEGVVEVVDLLPAEPAADVGGDGVSLDGAGNVE